jgi:hypothetical protein
MVHGQMLLALPDESKMNSLSKKKMHLEVPARLLRPE